MHLKKYGDTALQVNSRQYQHYFIPNDNHLEQLSLSLNLQLSDYVCITQNVFNSYVPGGAKLAHLERRPPSEGLKTGVSVPGECQERQDECCDGLRK